MTLLLGSYVAAFLTSLALVPACRYVARERGYVAKPTGDRWHTRPTPMLGGVALSVTVLGLMVLFGQPRALWVLLSAAGLMFAVGLADDVRSLRPLTKLIAEIAIASLLVFFGYRLQWVESLTGDTLLTLVWIVGITNAFNLLDNMDGLCIGVALIAGTSLLVVYSGVSLQQPEFVFLSLLLGAATAFLIYNLHPASVFLGDSGSLFIGVSLATLALGSGSTTSGQPNVLAVIAVPAFVLLIPIFDTTLVTLSRLLSGRAPATGGRDHSSHRLVAIGLSERAAVGVLWALAAIGGSVGVLTRYVSPDWSVLLGVLFLLAMAIFAVYLAHVRVYEDADQVGLASGTITPLVVNFMAISEFPKGRKYLISLSFRGKASVRPAQVGGFDVNIVIHGSTAVRGRGDLVAYRWALWKLTAPWTHRTRPPHLGKRCAFSTSSTGPFPSNHSRKTPKGPKIALGNPDRPNFIYRRRVAEVVLDVCLVSVAYYAAYRLRFEGSAWGENFPLFLQSLPIVVGVQLVSLFVTGAYQGVWRHFSLADTVIFAKSVLVGTASVVIVLLFGYRFADYSRTVFVIYALLLMLLLAGSRSSFRLMGEFIRRRRRIGERVVVYGADDAGIVALREVVGQPDSLSRMIGFVDDDITRHGTRVHGYMVLGGYENLLSLIQTDRVDTVVLCTNLVDAVRLTELKHVCADQGVALSRMQVDMQRLVAG